jgi:hypothetical protein
MYAGNITSTHDIHWLGAHQKLNRLAFYALRRYVYLSYKPLEARSLLTKFPSLKMIQYYEGVNGPDGIKLKSPGQDEPWHFYNPYDKQDTEIFSTLDVHAEGLQKALKQSNSERAAFEAAWLAHGLVDGLTPAHHYPYEEEMEHIRGEAKESRDSKRKKLTAQGDNKRDTVRRTWKLLGRKGLMTTHVNFEAGVASVLLPVRRTVLLSGIEVAYAREHGLHETFRTSACFIADLDLYSRFYKYGWTIRLTQDVRWLLIPQLAKTVALAWLLSLEAKD